MTVTDTWNIRLVILALAVITVLAVTGTVYLIATGHDPGDLKTTAAASLGGLTGILATTRSTQLETGNLPADPGVE